MRASGNAAAALSEVRGGSSKVSPRSAFLTVFISNRSQSQCRRLKPRSEPAWCSSGTPISGVPPHRCDQTTEEETDLQNNRWRFRAALRIFLTWPPADALRLGHGLLPGSGASAQGVRSRAGLLGAAFLSAFLAVFPARFSSGFPAALPACAVGDFAGARRAVDAVRRRALRFHRSARCDHRHPASVAGAW